MVNLAYSLQLRGLGMSLLYSNKIKTYAPSIINTVVYYSSLLLEA